MNIFIILITCITALYSCSNELDPVIPGETIPVVYFRMNPTDSLFYLTLTHSFSGNENGFGLAGDPAKVFYESADVRLERWLGKFKVGETRFTVTDQTKNPGIFPEASGYCYQAFNELSLISAADISSVVSSFRLVVDVNGSSGPVTSTIPLVPNPSIEQTPKLQKEFELYPATDHFMVDYWIDPVLVKYCELVCIFRYQEYAGIWIDHSQMISLKKNMERIYSHGLASAHATLYPDQFYNKVAMNIKPINDTISRRFTSMDLIFFAGDQQYEDYRVTYINSGNLDAPPMGNINNGYGLFTMVRTVKTLNMSMSFRTLDSLASGQYTKRLGFHTW